MQKRREKMLKPLSKHGLRKRIALKKKLKVTDFKFIKYHNKFTSFLVHQVY